MKTIILSVILWILLISGVCVLNDTYAEFLIQKSYEQQLLTIQKLAGVTANDDARTMMDKLRIFVNDHSSHNMDDEFYGTWKNPEIMAGNIIAHATGKRADFAHMECSTRAQILHDIAALNGIKTRSIYVWEPGKRLESHTFMEFKNQKTNKWETQDPDYDIVWARADDTNIRVPFIEVTKNLGAHTPCGRATCGMNHKSREQIAASVFERYGKIVTIIDRDHDMRASFYAPDVNPDTVYPEAYSGRTKDGKDNGRANGTFCDIWPKNCRNGFYPADQYEKVWKD